MTSRWTSRCVLFIVVNCLWVGLGAEPVGNNGSRDCGNSALYHLLRLEGRAVELNQLQTVLPSPGPDGHSFRELRDAAQRFGLRVDAVVLPRHPPAIFGPTLVFFKNGLEGHFVVARPVGHTGLLVQILDGEQAPSVVDAERLLGLPSWTGLALIPHRTNYLALYATVILLCGMVVVSWLCGMVVVSWLAWNRRRIPLNLAVLDAGPNVKTSSE